MCKFALAALLSAYALPVSAQSLPNYGNYQALDDNFRIGVQASFSNPAIGNLQQQAAFHQSNITDITTYLDPAEIAAYATQIVTPAGAVISSNQIAQFFQISGVFDLRGAPVLAGYAQNSPVLTVRFLDRETGATLIGKDGQPCSFTYNGLNRTQSFNQFDAATDSDLSPDTRLYACLSQSWSSSSPVDPLVGNPWSLQGTMTRDALDFTAGDSLVELDPNANSAGDPWQIGATYQTGTADRFSMSRIDARINKGWRILAGSRARLKLDLPFSFTTIKGAQAYTAQVGLGLEVPVKTNVWSIEPRVAYGITYSGDQGSLGHIAQGSIASRYVIRGLGRGQLLVGNLVGWSATLATPGDFNLNPDVKAWMFRNGLAYELPLKMRVAGRSTSLRASYAFTDYAGAKLYNNNFHEMTLSFGIRGREDTAKQFRDTVRINLNTIQAAHFHTYTVGLGFRF
jgi:hypothetical protein